MADIIYKTKQEVGSGRERKQVVIDEALLALVRETGTLTTDLLLERAEDPRHPLHRYFEWDDSVAAKKYRQAQALAMIQANKVVATLIEQRKNAPALVVGAYEVRGLVSPFRGEGFRMRTDALVEPDLRAAMIEKKYAVLRAWVRETVDIEELALMRQAILKLLPSK
jgi:hypothetical protein